jgi:hypothetical protein
VVRVFDLTGHLVRDSGLWLVLADRGQHQAPILRGAHQPPVDSPQAAVRAAIVAEAKVKK